MSKVQLGIGLLFALVIGAAGGYFYSLSGGDDLSSRNADGVQRGIAQVSEPSDVVQRINECLLNLEPSHRTINNFASRDKRAKCLVDPGLATNKPTVHNQVDYLVDYIISEAGKNPSDYGLQVYAVFARALRGTGEASADRPFAGMLWRLGGIVRTVSHLYAMVIGGLKNYIYNKHLYSDTAIAFFNYLVLPKKGWDMDKLWVDFCEFQRYSEAKLIPAVDEAKKWAYQVFNQFDADSRFAYDRTLLASNKEPLRTDDRYAWFIPAYLKAALVYTEMTLGYLFILNAYNVDGLSDFMEAMFHRNLKTAKKRLLSKKYNNIFRRDDRLKMQVITLNTPRDYADLLRDYSGTHQLFHLRTNDDQVWAWNGGNRGGRKKIERTDTVPYKAVGTAEDALKLKCQKHDGNSSRREAWVHFGEAARQDVEFIELIDIASEWPNQESYVLDHDWVLSNPTYEKGRVQAIADLFKGKTPADSVPYPFENPVTGERFHLNMGALFDDGLEEDLLYYYPTQFTTSAKHKGLAQGQILLDGLPSWAFMDGRPRTWKDQSFGGFILDANKEKIGGEGGAELYRAHRALTYNNDLDVISNFVLFWFM